MSDLEVVRVARLRNPGDFFTDQPSVLRDDAWLEEYWLPRAPRGSPAIDCVRSRRYVAPKALTAKNKQDLHYMYCNLHEPYERLWEEFVDETFVDVVWVRGGSYRMTHEVSVRRMHNGKLQFERRCGGCCKGFRCVAFMAARWASAGRY